MGKAIEVAAAQDTLWETIEKGGYVGHAILVLGAISFLIAFLKMIQVSRFKVLPRHELNLILDDLLNGKRADAAKKASLIPGDAGDLIRIGVENFHEKRRVLEESLFEKLVTIRPKLDSYLPFLALTAAAGPLMGLLGTVLGIIKTFQAMALYGSGNQKNFTAGISEALITTSAGLVIAIPALFFYAIFRARVEKYVAELEAAATHFMALLNTQVEYQKQSDSYAPSRRAPEDYAIPVPSPLGGDRPDLHGI
jgi:biopolymer transport protein ExbB